MTEVESAKMNALDEAAEKAVGYVVNMINKDTCYHLRDVIQKGVEPADFTLRELGQFILL